MKFRGVIVEGNGMRGVEAKYTVSIYDNGAIHKSNYRENYILSYIFREEESDLYRDYVVRDIYILPKYLNKLSSLAISKENAGGKSEFSEAHSIDYFITRFGMTDIIYEMDIRYWIDYKMIDYIGTISGQRIGISVTRGMCHKDPNLFTYGDALDLLNKKLYGLIVSRNGVVSEHNFYKSILHIWCQNEKIAYILSEAYNSFDMNDFGLNIKGAILLLLTVCEDERIYTNVY